ncbi:hypothetical protein GCM10027418_15010 [Mariniluteicoccus endophyticus]
MGAVTVVGDSLAGMAAAARLAKVGHRVTLVDVPGAAPSGLPDVFAFPAPWRDLLKKSGRAFDAELTRAGLALAPVASRTIDAPDGPFELPAERGAQWHALSARFGEPVAARWRDLLDELDDVWQERRRQGLEFEHDPAYAKAHRHQLWADRTVEKVARRLDHPVLSEVVRGAAEGDPRRSPATDCVWLSVERTFGLWQVVDAGGAPAGTGALVGVLRRRLATRGVVRGPADDDAPEADAVVSATGSIPTDWLGRPRPWWRRTGPRTGGHTYACGSHTAAGSTMQGQLLSAALAAYAVHRDLTGEDIHPTNKDVNRRRPRT